MEALKGFKFGFEDEEQSESVPVSLEDGPPVLRQAEGREVDDGGASADQQIFGPVSTH